MKQKTVEQFKNKTKVFIKRKNGYGYTGTIIAVTDSDVTFLDRKGWVVVLDLEEIVEIIDRGLEK